ncbi:hypothetical protein [Methylobacterium sp. Gmos1]
MAPKTTTFDDTESFLDHFKALGFDAKKTVLAGCQADMEATIAERLAALDAERAELMALTGKPGEIGKGDEPRSRPSAPPKYRDPVTGQTSTGRGSWQKADWVQAHLARGGTIEQLLIGPDNPLPEHLNGAAPAEH